MLLNDKMLYDKTIEAISREQVNAEWALKKVSSSLKTMFLEITDDYLKERAADIVHVSDRIMRNLIGAPAVNIAEIDKRVILVAHDLSPADTSQIHLERVKGFLTDLGGKASHTGIIARTLEIPAVLGLERAPRMIKNDDILIVDGNDGIVIINPSDKTLVEYEERQARYEAYTGTDRPQQPSAGRNGRRFRLPGPGQHRTARRSVSVINNGGDGVGLYRTEFQYMGRTDFPSEDELFDKYKDVVEVMAPNPVTIRTLDINGDKALGNAIRADEANPALGLRAIRYCLQKPDVFKTQLGPFSGRRPTVTCVFCLPMISSYEEIIEANQAAATRRPIHWPPKSVAL